MSVVASLDSAPHVAPGARVPQRRRRAPRRLHQRQDRPASGNLPDVPKIDLPNVKVPRVAVPGQGAGKGGASPGYKPASGGGELYVGQGKYIPDDQEGFAMLSTGRDSTLVGGFAGGEKACGSTARTDWRRTGGGAQGVEARVRRAQGQRRG